MNQEEVHEDIESDNIRYLEDFNKANQYRVLIIYSSTQLITADSRTRFLRCPGFFDRKSKN